MPAQFRNRILYRDPSTIVPICVREGIDLGAPAGKAKKKKKKSEPPKESEEVGKE